MAPMNARLLRPIASGKFDPRSIAGLVGWWDPSDTATVTTDSGAVSQLNDKSGLARHATQTTPNNRPAYSGTINGRNVMTFDGSNDRLVTGLESNTLTGYATFFCVCQVDATWSDATANNKTPLYGRNASGAGASYGINLTTATPASGTLGLSVQWRGAGFNFVGSPPVAKGVPQLLVGRPAATGRLRRVNGSGSEVTSSPPAAGTDAAAGNFLHIGEDPTQNRFWSDLIAEVLVYDRDLTLAEIAKIEGYLGKKWGITIA
jgi:hypothetical protein